MIVGIGIDAVDIDRVERMFADKGERMLQRLFTDDELAYIKTEAVAGPAPRRAARREGSRLQGACGQRARSRHRLARRRGVSRGPTVRPSCACTGARRSGSRAGGDDGACLADAQRDDGGRGGDRRALSVCGRRGLHHPRESRYIPSAMIPHCQTRPAPQRSVDAHAGVGPAAARVARSRIIRSSASPTSSASPSRNTARASMSRAD